MNPISERFQSFRENGLEMIHARGLAAEAII
jgi:hypothetical protein